MDLKAWGTLPFTGIHRQQGLRRPPAQQRQGRHTQSMQIHPWRCHLAAALPPRGIAGRGA